MRYTNKPIIISAIKYTGKNARSIIKFMGCPSDAKASKKTIKTLKCKMHINKGDWVIQGTQGEFYALNSYIFKKTYEKLI
jgi:hypothetical protein